VQFDALWSSTSKTSTNNKASTSQGSVETCDDQIAQENDHLKREVKKLEFEVNKLKITNAYLKREVKKLEPRLLTMFLILILMFFIFLICHTMISMLLMCL
jgi:ABC-type lipoprotein release transport system permease subunit